MDSNSGQHWTWWGTSCSKEFVVFTSQVILVYIIVITSIINLTLYQDNESSGKLWTALLSSSIGYLLPNPRLKIKNDN